MSGVNNCSLLQELSTIVPEDRRGARVNTHLRASLEEITSALHLLEVAQDQVPAEIKRLLNEKVLRPEGDFYCFSRIALGGCSDLRRQ